MMTYMASRPRILQGTGGAGGWGLGPQTIEQSWQLQGPVTSSTDSSQPLVALFMGSISWAGRSVGRIVLSENLHYKESKHYKACVKLYLNPMISTLRVTQMEE